MPSPEACSSTLRRRNSVDSLPTDNNDIAVTANKISKAKAYEEMQNFLSEVVTKNSHTSTNTINDLPETEIGDMFFVASVPACNRVYENSETKQHVKNKNNEPPPLPPKPLSLLEPFSAPTITETFLSSSSSDLTSLDNMSGCSFTMWPIIDLNMQSESCSSVATCAPLEKNLVSTTLDRLSGMEGYMALTASRKQVANNPYIDNIYDGVFHMMESIRNAETADSKVTFGGIFAEKKQVQSSKSMQDKKTKPLRFSGGSPFLKASPLPTSSSRDNERSAAYSNKVGDCDVRASFSNKSLSSFKKKVLLLVNVLLFSVFFYMLVNKCFHKLSVLNY